MAARAAHPDKLLVPEPLPPRVAQEVSSGGIVFRRAPQGPEYLLLKYGAGHWDFPKGHVEQGETATQAAQREIAEETGIAPEQQDFVVGFKDLVTYFYRRGSVLVRKEVHFYIVEAPAEAAVKLSHEHLEFAWLPLDKAMERLTFKTARDLLAKANRFLIASGLLREPRA